MQLREQVLGVSEAPASDEEVSELAAQLHSLCVQHGAYLLVNGNLQLARGVAVHGMHLGTRSNSLSEVRQVLGAGAILGYSAHGVLEAETAQQHTADYLLLSPVFVPISKTSSRETCGTAELQRVSQACTIPVFALGGITAGTVGHCRRAGAAGIRQESGAFSEQKMSQAHAVG